MSRTADVAIIGAGIMGASTAYHLALRGCTDVLLLEAADMPGTGSTGVNAGGIRHQFSTAANIELSKRSIAMMERFEDELGVDPGLVFCGYLFVLDRETDLERFRRDVALQNELGVPSRLLDAGDVARLAPELDPSGILGGSFCPRDGLVDPSALLQGYIRGARRLGVRLETDARVTAMEPVGGGWRLATPQGPVEADAVVIAAGPWSGDVARLAGLDLPVAPVRRQMAVTRPIPALRPDFPFIIDFSRLLYFHRESGGILTGMSDPDQPVGYDTSVDPEWTMRHLERAVERLPLLADAALLTEWAGLYEVTPDHQPILGRLPPAGLYANTGFSGHGLMQGPIAGLLLAEEILDGRASSVDIEAFRFGRFAAAAERPERNVV